MKELLSRSRSLTASLCISLVVFTVCRVLFFIYNLPYFSSSVREDALAFFFGIWFDVVPVFYYNLLFILLHILPHPWWGKVRFVQLLKWLFLFTNSVAVLQNLGDIPLFPFSKKRTGIEIFHLSKEWDLAQIQAYIADFWFIPLFFLFFLYCIKRAYEYILHKFQGALSTGTNPFSIHFASQWGIFLLFWSGVVVLALRGGVGLIPLRTFDAGKYVVPSLVPLTINTPFQLICTIEGNIPERLHYMNQEASRKLIKPEKHFKGDQFQKKNIVIIIVESLGKEYMGFYNNGKGYTPFLDSLCQHSLSYNNSFANGTISMDAPPAIFSGIPHLMEDNYITSHFNVNTPGSIGSILAAEGYTSAFYHGARNGTMGFDNFISLSGMGEYFGLNEYPNQQDFDGRWGIFDGPYLSYYAQELNKRKEPFISSVFTLSSHHPYTVPPPYNKLLPSGSLPIHKSIAYADASLRLFFDKAKKMPWYNNTLFVITADHTSDSENPIYQTPFGRYAIPIIFFTPDQQLKGVRKNVMQQSLIIPSVLKYLGYAKPFFSLGQPALNESDSTSAVFYSNGFYSLLQDSLALTMYHEKELKLFNFIKDPYLTQDLFLNEGRKSTDMSLYLRAYLQEYSDFLHENKNLLSK